MLQKLWSWQKSWIQWQRHLTQIPLFDFVGGVDGWGKYSITPSRKMYQVNLCMSTIFIKKSLRILYGKITPPPPNKHMYNVLVFNNLTKICNATKRLISNADSPQNLINKNDHDSLIYIWPLSTEWFMHDTWPMNYLASYTHKNFSSDSKFWSTNTTRTDMVFSIFAKKKKKICHNI